MKCLDKKRIKMKQGETLALNERTMLSLVSTGVSEFHWIFDVDHYFDQWFECSNILYSIQWFKWFL